MSAPVPKNRVLRETIKNLQRDTRADPLPMNTVYYDGDGNIRCITGLQDDGSYGIRVWDVNGAVVVDQTGGG